MWSIDEIQKVWHLAAKLHHGQVYRDSSEGGEMPYLFHVGSVTFEMMTAVVKEPSLNADLAIKCAILHDTIEDTRIDFHEVRNLFGQEVVNGVMALTKNEELGSKREMMEDSLQRIKQQPKEVWAVKMADRICNLYLHPHHWSKEKMMAYRDEALFIHDELKEGSTYLADRLENRILAYSSFMTG
ncbi:MAG: HD domain-containing protein [Bacteroidota bacterium]